MSQDTQDPATPIERAIDSAVESILVQTSRLEALEGSKPAGEPLGLKGLRDVPMPVSIELGRARLPLGELMALAPGSLVPLDRAAHEPVDIYVGGKLYARGEVVTIGTKYGIRVTALVSE
ncbi:MAG: FliM/FliN family flagellar motor switch protein [Planctomycetota bacterium]